ncbi:hypothetical protein [Geobacter sp. AOG2]|uniref:hypothetical protein n=1 Tax=Geobacter sp. AOG2 TaxID=1566347 RepID=UPI001CC7B4D2|nr:hypothetical protein [Geobacter sp. AOG2]GFE62783.1 hypothetical protein AOG2_33710 [Geobacter sp. AOG2]
MFKRPLPEETRYTIILIAAVIVLPILFFSLNKYYNSTPSALSSGKDKEKTVIVSEAEKADILTKATAKPVAATVRDALSQGDYSTAHLELSRLPKDSPEYEKLSKQLAADPRARKLPGVRKEADTTQSPVRYLDESTPHDRFSDGLYLYLVEVSGSVWPRFCIQSVGKQALDITAFRIKAGVRTYTIPATAIKQEKSTGKVAEYYDVPVDQLSYDVMLALIKTRKASLTYIGKSGERVRAITDDEIKGLTRMMHAYTALGGSFAFVQHESGGLTGATHDKSAAATRKRGENREQGTQK